MRSGGGFFVAILDLIFPKRCVSCGRIGKYFCDRCRALIRVIKSNEPICPMCEKPAIGGITHPKCKARFGIDGLTSFFHYDGPVRKAIKAVKYRLVSDLANEFISLISIIALNELQRQIPSTSADNNVLIPIPLHPHRLRGRGFNQAEVLGKLLAGRLHIALAPDILRRVRETVPQVAMRKRDARLRNMQGVFGLSRRHGIQSVLLFDDVFTTGATMRSAANVLKRGGVKHVWAVTIAR